MISKIEVERFWLTSAGLFEEVLASIKGAVGHPDMAEFVFFSRDGQAFTNQTLSPPPVRSWEIRKGTKGS
jgi:hypothetical protein